MADKTKPDYGWVAGLGWAVAVIIGLIWLWPILTGNNEKSTNTVTPTVNQSSSSRTSELEEVSETGWQCVDATSYNRNAYDDNKCTNGDDVRYVSDSQAEELDPDYSSGKSGASYYNSR